MVVFDHFPHPNTPQGHSTHLVEQRFSTEGVFSVGRGCLAASLAEYESLMCPLVKTHLARD